MSDVSSVKIPGSHAFRMYSMACVSIYSSLPPPPLAHTLARIKKIERELKCVLRKRRRESPTTGPMTLNLQTKCLKYACLRASYRIDAVFIILIFFHYFIFSGVLFIDAVFITFIYNIIVFYRYFLYKKINIY